MSTRQPGGVTPVEMPDGRIRYRVRLTLAGKRKSLGYYDSEDEAWKVLAGALGRHKDQIGGITLVGWMVEWLDRRELDGLHRSMGSQRSAFRARISKAKFAQWPVHRIERVHIVAWVRKMLRTPPEQGHGHKSKKKTRTARQTVCNTLNVLRQALQDAADEGLAPTNAATGVKVPKVPSSDTWTFLELDEIAAIEALPITEPGKRTKGHITPMQRAAIRLAIYTGLRQGELWGLQWGDVHLDDDRPRVVVRFSYRGPTKNGRTREVPLIPQARDALREWQRVKAGVGRALVFPAKTAGCRSKGYDAGWARVRQLAGIRSEVVFHSLRHTFASHMVMGHLVRDRDGKPQPISLELIKEMLGHESITTTERYSHLAPGAVHDAIRALTESISGPTRDHDETTEQENL